ncbi:hypothetical protein M8J76_008104 [Diaphorina citri]|nr:hypothetical protein M8J75_003943 [Diaphorina citri]KAI5709009.1 hypothetical protein M8J76_008104 [Diaphorina citri]
MCQEQTPELGFPQLSRTTCPFQKALLAPSENHLAPSTCLHTLHWEGECGKNQNYGQSVGRNGRWKGGQNRSGRKLHRTGTYYRKILRSPISKTFGRRNVQPKTFCGFVEQRLELMVITSWKRKLETEFDGKKRGRVARRSELEGPGLLNIVGVDGNNEKDKEFDGEKRLEGFGKRGSKLPVRSFPGKTQITKQRWGY